MKALSFEQIESLTHGVARVEEGDGKISFFRFTKEQQELYKTVSEDFYIKSFATVGVSLEFITDSENLLLSVSVAKGSSRTFFTHSIFVDGKRIGELSGNISAGENVPFEEKFQLGVGMKKVRIQFPWSVASRLVALELDENATVIPTKKKCNVLMFGDSITQGYDAMLPENAYSIRIADLLDAEVRNKGIGGEQFFAKLTLEKEDFTPDLVTVAYGTNDWRHSTKERFERECKGFFVNLRNSYPNAKIIAITPIWRADMDNKQEFGKPFNFIGEYIKKVSETVSDMTVIDGIDLVPHNLKYYQTDGLHPIDSGFEHYTNNLWEKIN